MLDALRLPEVVPGRSGPLTVRRASGADLDAVMGLLADDPISASRGDRAAATDIDAYASALDAVLLTAGNDLIVAEDAEGRVVGTLQLTLIPGMARRGATRLLVEAVRVSSAVRSAGIGSALMRWVMRDAAVATGASLVQLTSDAARTDAHRFYTRLGFADSHVGFKYTVAG